MTEHGMQARSLVFQDGVPGFPQLRRFQLTTVEPDGPFFSLQSLEDEQIGFWAIDPFPFFPQYEFTLSEQVKAQLQIEEDTPVFVCNVVSIRDEGQITVNLKAPIVVNEATQMAKQIILNGDQYEIRQPLMKIQVNATSGAGGSC